MRMFLTIILFCATGVLMFAQGSKTGNTDSDTDSELQMIFPSASIHHPGLSDFIFDRLMPMIRKENSPYGEVRLKISFSRFSETSPISVDLKLSANNGLRELTFVDSADRGRAYVCKGNNNFIILIHDNDSIAIKESIIVRSEKDSLEINEKNWTRIGINDSDLACRYFGFTIDNDSIYLDTYKNYGADYNDGLIPNDEAINSILPKKSKSTLEREERKRQKARDSACDTLRILDIPKLDQLQKKQ